MHTRRADLLLAITADQVPDRSCAPRPLERKTSLAKLTFAGIAPGGRVAVSLTSSVPASSAAGMDCEIEDRNKCHGTSHAM